MDKQLVTRKRRRTSYGKSRGVSRVVVESSNEAKLQEATRIARQALSLVKKQERSKEIKVHDLNYTAGQSSTAAIVELTTGARQIAEGLGYNERIGSEIHLKKIYMNVTIGWNATPTSQLFKLSLVRGYHEDGTIINVNDVYQNNSVESLRTWHDRRKVDVLWTKTFSLNRSTGVAANHTHFEFVKTLNYKTMYTTGGGSAPENGGLYLYLVSDEPVDVPVILFTGRVFYTDS